MIVVDKTTGLEIARALDMSGKLDQKNALTVANLVRYIKARETTIPASSSRTTGWRASCPSPRAPARNQRSGPPETQSGRTSLRQDTSVQVFVKSVSLLNERTAEVRFSTTEKTLDRELEHHWVGIAKVPLFGRTRQERMALRQPARLPGDELPPRSGIDPADGDGQNEAGYCSNSARARHCRAQGTAWGHEGRAISQPSYRLCPVQPGRVTTIRCELGVSTLVDLGPGEIIETISTGDSKSWSIVPEERIGHLLREAA